MAITVHAELPLRPLMLDWPNRSNNMNITPHNVFTFTQSSTSKLGAKDSPVK